MGLKREMKAGLEACSRHLLVLLVSTSCRGGLIGAIDGWKLEPARHNLPRMVK